MHLDNFILYIRHIFLAISACVCYSVAIGSVQTARNLFVYGYISFSEQISHEKEQKKQTTA